jgi:hypothetical protein
MTLSLFAQELIKQPAQLTTTEHVNFVSGGIIRINDSYGDLKVDGWDQPEVQVTVIKSMPYDYKFKQPDEAAKHLDRIRVITQRSSGTELTISTAVKKRGGVMLEYHIQVPRNSQLVIHQSVGDVLIRDVTGDIQATCRLGDITLWLSNTRTYSIDARSRAGTIFSDFSGVIHSHYLFGQTFSSLSPAPSQRLHLRVGFGGIAMKPILPESETPAPPTGRQVGRLKVNWR